MTIRAQLDRIKAQKTQIQSVLAAKGITITEGEDLATSVAKINTLSAAGGSGTGSSMIAGMNFLSGSGTTMYATSSTLTQARAPYITPDGTRFYLGCDGTDKIYQWNFGTPYDWTTLTYIGSSPSVSSKEGAMRGFWLNETGTKAIVSGGIGHHLYNLGTPWNVSSMVWVSTANWSAQQGSTGNTARGAAWIPGTNKFVYCFGFSNGSGALEEFEITGGNTLVINKTLDIGSELIISGVTGLGSSASLEGPRGLAWHDDGYSLIVAGGDYGKSIFRYKLTTPYDIASIKQNYKEIYDITTAVDAALGAQIRSGSFSVAKNETSKQLIVCITNYSTSGLASFFKLAY